MRNQHTLMEYRCSFLGVWLMLLHVTGVAYGLHGVAGTDNSDSAVIDPQTLIVSTAAEAQVGPHATSQAGKSPAANTSCPAPVVSTSRTWFSQAWHNCNNVDAKEQQACINTWAQQLMKLEGQECEATANGPTCQDCINIWINYKQWIAWFGLNLADGDCIHRYIVGETPAQRTARIQQCLNDYVLQVQSAAQTTLCAAKATSPERVSCLLAWADSHRLAEGWPSTPGLNNCSGVITRRSLLSSCIDRWVDTKKCQQVGAPSISQCGQKCALLPTKQLRKECVYSWIQGHQWLSLLWEHYMMAGTFCKLKGRSSGNTSSTPAVQAGGLGLSGSTIRTASAVPQGADSTGSTSAAVQPRQVSTARCFDTYILGRAVVNGDLYKPGAEEVKWCTIQIIQPFGLRCQTDQAVGDCAMKYASYLRVHEGRRYQGLTACLNAAGRVEKGCVRKWVAKLQQQDVWWIYPCPVG